ncbi:ferritin-like domain-containing protein [Salegentibacter sp. F188]|uniref:Ferritin-like domain-containing protein n=1 Tax=Autumnicola patrickiae TaxID=3075591 RepID=A0ABU3DXC3_9FLAO|nr:ferritin-like domain-containing protein [Salegentibacter sp. F188]MDT0688372.1 ferritin-like domain-containing protein [Salegentibacter sp. F188]
MSLIKMLDGFTSKNLMKKRSSRREMFATVGSLGKKAAAAAVPFGLATNKVNAAAFFQETTGPVEALQFALLLERLEDQFYMMALESGVLTGRGARVENVFMDISAHESAHVEFLENNLTDAGADVSNMPTFDFTAGGLFDPFNDNGDADTAYAQVLALAQAFEDTGVRAYKGQAPNLMNTPYLEPALRIHSVEARHAAAIRRIRGLEGWITLDNPGAGIPTQAEGVYAGEANVTQGGVDLTTLDYGDSPLVGDVAEAVSQAFDEPLSMDDVSAIAGLFIAADNGESDEED